MSQEDQIALTTTREFLNLDKFEQLKLLKDPKKQSTAQIVAANYQKMIDERKKGLNEDVEPPLKKIVAE